MREAYWKGWLGVVALASAGCGASEGASNAAAEAESVRVVNVEVAVIGTEPFADYLHATGEVEAMYDITLSAEESGRLVAFPVEKGRAVGRGQVIAELDAGVLRAQVDEARASATLAREQFERQRQLWEVEKIGSEIAFLQAKSNAEVAAARLATLEARLERTRIRTPVAGVFDTKYAEVGEMAMPGMPVARIVSTRQVKITAGVPERDALAVGQTEPVMVTFDALPGREFRGRINYIGARVDSVNRTVPIEVLLDNPAGQIKAGMVANVRVARGQLVNAVVVPQQVVLRTEDGYEAFVVVEQDGRPVARSRPVSLGPSYGDRVVVRDGLMPGDRLVVVGQHQVNDGGLVRIVNRPDSTAAAPGGEESR
jgi:RND family efflux transporter MFP subunit